MPHVPALGFEGGSVARSPSPQCLGFPYEDGQDRSGLWPLSCGGGRLNTESLHHLMVVEPDQGAPPLSYFNIPVIQNSARGMIGIDNRFACCGMLIEYDRIFSPDYHRTIGHRQLLFLQCLQKQE